MAAVGLEAGWQLHSSSNYTDATRTVLEESSVRSKTDAGWVVGLGMDFAFTQNIIGKVEYLHADFGGSTISDVFVGNPGINGRFETTVDLLKVGLAWKF